MKWCNKCSTTKSLSEFAANKRAKDGRSSQCKECSNAYNREYYIKNAETICKRTSAHSKANPHIWQKSCKKWRDNNPEKATARFLKYKHSNLELCRQRGREYHKNNPDKITAKNAKFKCDKLQRTPKWLTEDQLDDIKFMYLMSSLLTKSTGIQHHVDHMVPLRGKKVSGLHVPWNLQVLTATDNLKKINKFTPGRQP